MEAASARMAARDRHGSWDTPSATPLQRFVQNACDPQNFEPNLALNLEISDLINQKKGPAPREAAIAIVQYVNNRNPNVSLLALNLLDICVKNCGYPFHLQISTKEFLNELVRRFPERPPLRYSRVQSKIMELIEEWRSSICQTSKYKDDLGFIRDMHRLLSYKGYTFPAVKREDVDVLNPSDRLQSAEEMEEEERAAQSAKLQELIRRGTPHDLQEANKLMKVMAGFDTRSKTDYRAKAAEEVGKVQQKARLLEEMLQNHRPGDTSIKADGFEDLANALASAHPRIQKMCEEESDDTEAVAKLLEINDSIHRTLQRYRLVKAGDLEGANKIPRGTLGTSGAGVSKGRGNELNLIDFGPADPVSGPGPSSSAAVGSSLENDLLGLSLDGSNSSSASGGASTAPGQISLGGGNLSDLLANYPGTNSAAGNPSVAANSATQNRLSQQVQQQAAIGHRHTPSFERSIRTSSLPPPPAPSNAAASTRPAATTLASRDPFAALSSSNASSPRQQSRAATPSQPAPSHLDEEWTFESAVPAQPQEFLVTNTSVHIVFHVSRSPGVPNELLVKSTVSNNEPQPVSQLTLQVAVVRPVQLRLETQSGQSLQPLQRGGITQFMHLSGVEPGAASNVRLRWKATYFVGATPKDETGEVRFAGIS